MDHAYLAVSLTHVPPPIEEDKHLWEREFLNEIVYASRNRY